MSLLTPGTQAPELDSLDQHGRAVRLGDARGKLLVLFFYPENDTPGCVAEACAFRDLDAQFAREDILVWGVSTASVESHRAFAQKHRLPFRLLADEDGVITNAFGAMNDNGIPRRVSYLIGIDGRVEQVFPKVTPDRHPAEVLEAARRLRTAAAQR